MSHRGVFIRAAVAAAGVLTVLAAAYGLYLVRTIIVYVLVGLFVAISLEPLVQALMRRRLSRGWAVGVVVVLAVGMLVVFAWSVVPPIVREGTAMVNDLPGQWQRFAENSSVMREVTDRYQLTDRLSGVVAAVPERMVGGAAGAVQQFAGGLASTCTVVVLAVYFMAGLPRLRRATLLMIPAPRRAWADRAVGVAADKVGAYMIGNLTISLIAGLAAFGCLVLAGVPFALPLAVTVAVADLIPMIGATLGAVICVAVTLFTVGPWPGAILVAAFFVAYQQLENYLIAPRVLHGSVDLSAVTVLLVALTGGVVLGLVGAVMAIPLAATVKVLLSPTAESEDDHEVTSAASGPGVG